MLTKTRREDVEECLRLLAVHVAEYKRIHGPLSYDGAMDLLSRESLDGDQAMRLADGLEIVVGMLAFIAQGRRPQ